MTWKNVRCKVKVLEVSSALEPPPHASIHPTSPSGPRGWGDGICLRVCNDNRDMTMWSGSGPRRATGQRGLLDEIVVYAKTH